MNSELKAQSFVRNEKHKITKDPKYNGLAGIKEVVFEVSDNDDESERNPQTITKLFCSSKTEEIYHFDIFSILRLMLKTKKLLVFLVIFCIRCLANI